MIPLASEISQQTNAKDLAVPMRSPLEQLLHALNQPLTALQCSMEVALILPRTPEQHVRVLREGLELTERMRGLVEAIREITDIEAEKKPLTLETIELTNLVLEAVEELTPVAEVKGIRLALDSGTATPWQGTIGKAQLATVLFRIVDSVLSLALPRTALQVEMRSAPRQLWVRMQWQAKQPRTSYSRPELGLLVARARLEQAGVEWRREEKQEVNAQNTEKLTILFPGTPSGAP